MRVLAFAPIRASCYGCVAGGIAREAALDDYFAARKTCSNPPLPRARS